MKIQTNIYYPDRNFGVQSQPKMDTPFVSNLHQESCDTVSFGNKFRSPKKARTAVNKVYDFFERIYYSTELTSKADGYLSALSFVPIRTPGVRYNSEYNRQGYIKTPLSYVSKFVRSGEKPKDQIRGTLFVKDLRDLSVTSNIIKEMEFLGYKLKYELDSKGNRVYDFDVRLNDVTKEEVSKLPKHLRNNISKGKASGYEDIQMRFIDNEGQEYELLVLCGQNMAEAKHAESNDVYGIVRNFKELNASTHKIDRSIGLIHGILEHHISQPLFNNAKQMDAGIELNLQKVGLSEAQSKLIINSFNEIMDEIKIYGRVNADTYTHQDKIFDQKLITKIKTDLNNTLEKYLIKTDNSAN